MSEQPLPPVTAVWIGGVRFFVDESFKIDITGTIAKWTQHIGKYTRYYEASVHKIDLWEREFDSTKWDAP